MQTLKWKRELKERVAALIHESAANGPLYLVFHDASQDVKYVLFGEKPP